MENALSLLGFASNDTEDVVGAGMPVPLPREDARAAVLPSTKELSGYVSALELDRHIALAETRADSGESIDNGGSIVGNFLGKLWRQPPSVRGVAVRAGKSDAQQRERIKQIRMKASRLVIESMPTVPPGQELLGEFATDTRRSSTSKYALPKHIQDKKGSDGMVWPLLIGVGVAAVVLAVRAIIDMVQDMKSKKSSAGSPWGKRFYEGGFEEPMTRREAALILGCRESASKERIMERYRALMKLNHPDMGGSPFLAAKVNDAKTFLGKRAISDGKSRGRRAYSTFPQAPISVHDVHIARNTPVVSEALRPVSYRCGRSVLACATHQRLASRAVMRLLMHHC